MCVLLKIKTNIFCPISVEFYNLVSLGVLVLSYIHTDERDEEAFLLVTCINYGLLFYGYFTVTRE